MPCVDGFVVAVPDANREADVRHAAEAARIFKEHGALAVVECWGDDVPRMRPERNPMPFDGKRMIDGGLRVVVDE